MADFDTAYNLVKRSEGGYQALPEDKGNYNSLGELVGTNWGVSAPKYERLIGRPPTKADMQNMPAWRARQAFKNDEWNRIKGDTIKSQELANIFFDGVVNHGRGVWLMQDVLGVTKDNKFGSETHNAILKADQKKLHDAYKERRIKYYHQIVEDDPTQERFLKGWLNRINSFANQFLQTVKKNPASSASAIIIPGIIAYFIYRSSTTD